MIKERFGKFRIERWIGGGQFADVFVGVDTITGKRFALKVCRMKEKETEMLKREAQLLASLDHPNIVRFYSADIIEGRLTLVMELVEGKSLRKVIEDEAPLDERDAIRIIIQVLRALDYAHSKGLLHRDIKPENILIDKSGTVKLTDFGLATVLSASMTMSVAGTPLYMPPEGWRGALRKESDIWSTAAVLYEMLSGSPPFNSETLEGLRNQILSCRVRKIPRISPELNGVLKQALHKDPEKRIRSAREFMELLNRICEGETITFHPGRGSKKVSVSLRGLTEEQIEAVVNGDGVFLVLGGAGTGKTTTLAHRIAYLVLDKEVPPDRIFAVTFSGKAVRDMREKIERLIGEGAVRNLWIGTFHNLSIKIISSAPERLGYPEEFGIVSREDQLEILKRVGEIGTETAKGILREISRAKAELIGPKEYAKKARNRWQKLVAKLYKSYQSELKKRGLFDYDDLIYYANDLLQKNPDLLELLAGRFQYIVVDEFQDINRAQFELLKLLSSIHGNLFVTGDDDQAIYGFRGASTKFLQELREFFPDCKEVRLTQNFRSPEQILSVAQNLINHNKGRIPKVLIPRRRRTNEDVVMLYAAQDEQEEAKFVAQKIFEFVDRGRSFDDFAVLYRINSLSRVFEEVFAAKGIPYNIEGTGGFYERDEVKAALGFLKFLMGQGEKDDFYLMLKVLLRFSPKEASLATKYFHKTGKPTFSKQLLEAKRQKLAAFWEFIRNYSEEDVAIRTPRELLEEVLDFTGYYKYLEEKDTPSRLSARENIDELLGLAGTYGAGGTRELLNHIALSKYLESQVRGASGVRLMTVHLAKGLEFPVVFVVGMIEGVFPLYRALSRDEEMEEERRLCYVAVTRAQEYLFITYPKRRFNRYEEPSRFLYEMYTRQV